MTQALVIRSCGDPKMCGAIIEGMTRQVIPIDQNELTVVKAELARLRAERYVRALGDSRRFQRARRELARKYATKPRPPVRGAILAVWGTVWLVINTAYNYFSEWNRS